MPGPIQIATMSLRMLVLLGAIAFSGSAAPPEVRTFDGDPVGQTPPGFSLAMARGMGPARWTVERAGANGLLAHHETAAGQGFALAVLEGPPRRSVELSARIRLVGGARAAGLVWHYQDEDNHYLARLDLRAQDLAVYRVVRGNRVRLEDEDDLELDPDAWYTLKVRHDGPRIRVYLAGIRVIDDFDRSRPVQGRVGLWSQVDTTAWFDDVRVRAVEQHDR